MQRNIYSVQLYIISSIIYDHLVAKSIHDYIINILSIQFKSTDKGNTNIISIISDVMIPSYYLLVVITSSE